MAMQVNSLKHEAGGNWNRHNCGVYRTIAQALSRVQPLSPDGLCCLNLRGPASLAASNAMSTRCQESISHTFYIHAYIHIIYTYDGI